MDIPHKIHVKLGDSEFMAEGSETTVKEQFDRFLDALSKFTADPKTKQPPVSSTAATSISLEILGEGLTFAGRFLLLLHSRRLHVNSFYTLHGHDVGACCWFCPPRWRGPLQDRCQPREVEGLAPPISNLTTTYEPHVLTPVAA